MKTTLGKLRDHIKRALTENSDAQINDEFNTVEVGDIVDVDVDEIGILPVRVLELVDDVENVSGPEDFRKPGEFSGTGFVGEIDPDSGESGTLVFSMNQVLPGSKAKGYFPKADSDNWNGDDRDDVVPNKYRKMANRFATKSIEPDNSYVSELSDD